MSIQSTKEDDNETKINPVQQESQQLPSQPQSHTPRFTDPPLLDHPMPAWIKNRTVRKSKKENNLRLPSRPAFAPPPRGMETQLTRPSPHTQHMFTPRAIESATHLTHATRTEETLALKKPIVSYLHAPIRPAIGSKGLKPFPYKIGSEKYTKATSPRVNEDYEIEVSSAATVAARNSPLKKKKKKGRTMSLESMNGEEEEEDEKEATKMTSTPLGEGGNVDDPQYLRIDLSKLPLELFDSTIYETKSHPSKWLQDDEGNDLGTTTGKSMYWVNGAWNWRSCDVLSYNEMEARYTIRFRGSQRLKKVRRINLRFDLEDPNLFHTRIMAAKKKREECKQRLRLEHYMLDMPVEEVAPISNDILKSICTRIAMPQVLGGYKRGTQLSENENEKNKNKNKNISENVHNINTVMLSKERTSTMLANMLGNVRSKYVDAVKYAQLSYMLHVLDNQTLKQEMISLNLLQPENLKITNVVPVSIKKKSHLFFKFKKKFINACHNSRLTYIELCLI